MKKDIMNRIYPGMADVNERISAEAVARANDLLRAANQLNGYVEIAFRQLTAASNTFESA